MTYDPDMHARKLVKEVEALLQDGKLVEAIRLLAVNLDEAYDEGYDSGWDDGKENFSEC